ncbi:HAD family hydrolase [Nocardia sp. NPDC060259]|uniref:HAD family hydrolase n=1 Tax=Nocardia sp. NPDC060259 TaxID=3347088 RepID=UPI00365FFAF9
MAACSTPAAVLFDIGMTLIHPSGEVMVDELRARGVTAVTPQRAEIAWAAAAESHHLDFPATPTRAQHVAQTWAQLLGQRVDLAAEAWLASAARPDLYRDLDDDAVTVLKSLCEGGIALAAVSNSDGTLTEELARFGLDRYFALMLDSTVVGCEKPNRKIFDVALTELGVHPAQTWFVGDGLVNDMFGAALAGIGHPVLYDRHSVYRPPLPVPVIGTLGVLPALIEKTCAA